MPVIKLKAKYNRAHYKTTNSYLSAVYRKNKKAIDAIFTEDQKKQMQTTGVTPYQAWRARLEEISKDQYTKKLYGEKPKVNQLLDRFSRSTQMRTKAEIFQENAIRGLKESLTESQLKLFRRYTGWKTKIDAKYLSYDGKEHVYTYETEHGFVKFDFTNSPKSVRISQMVNYDEEKRKNKSIF